MTARVSRLPIRENAYLNLHGNGPFRGQESLLSYSNGLEWINYDFIHTPPDYSMEQWREVCLALEVGTPVGDDVQDSENTDGRERCHPRFFQVTA